MPLPLKYLSHLLMHVVDDENARLVHEIIGAGDVGPATARYLGLQDSGVFRYAVGGNVESPARVRGVVGVVGRLTVGGAGRGCCGRAFGKSGRGLVRFRPWIDCRSSCTYEDERAGKILLEVEAQLDPG